MNEFFDQKECQSPQERQQDLLARLPQFVAYGMSKSDYYRSLFKGVAPSQLTTLEALAKLPVTRKSQLKTLQQQQAPLGGIDAEGRRFARLFQSPGPIYDPQGVTDDWWGMARAFHAAGFRGGDLVHNTLSYHLSPGGFIMDAGARACGCTVIPAGPGQTEQQLQAIEDLKPQGYCGTPSFLKILCQKAKHQDRDISSLTKALVTGEALPPSLRAELTAVGIHVLQAYASADLGLIAYETEADQGLMVNEDIILEIVRPGSGQPVAPGEVGEVVVTRFNHDYPLIRFATGDLSAVISTPSPCGRTNVRIKGWLGRADQSTKVKGMFVQPEQIHEVVNRHQEIIKARLQVTRDNDIDVMTLACEVADELADTDSLTVSDAIEDSLRDVTRLKGSVTLIKPNTLANDGIVIDDQRSYN